MVDHTLHRDTVPHRVGDRYVLIEELGRGGMASVYRAHDEVLDREVAIKLLHAHLAGDATFLDRFRREARAAAALSHPNVVAVHDWGETANGPYLVMQLVEGVSLRDVLRVRSYLPPDEAVAVLAPVAHGLGAAHAAGLVHRDVKPENLLLGRDGTVRITDFGLARAAASATSTFGGEVLVGSPHYLAPEAVRSEPVDARADVYALGVVLYECLVGQPPHQAESAFATAMAHLERPVPAPSDVRPDVPDWLDAVVATATAIDSEQRYANGAALARALTGRAGVVVPEAGGANPTAAAMVAGSDEVAAARHDTPDQAAATTPAMGVRAEPSGPPPPADVGPSGTSGNQRRHRPRRAWTAVLLALLLAGGGLLAWDQVIAPMTEVPDVVGEPVADARDQLLDAGFDVGLEPDRPHHLEVPEDHVISQEPSDQLRRGGTVVLVVSAGPAQVDVPDVVGDPADDAEEQLRTAGFEIALTHRHDEQVAEDRVISTEPEPGRTVDEASSVLLVISLGPTPIEVPELRGTAVQEADDQLAALDLVLDEVERRHDPDIPAGAVLSQSPKAGETLTSGEVVEVVVSDGPQPIEVPAVRDEPTDEAVAQLEELGFEVEVELSGGFGALLNPGRVFDQDPAPGAELLPGDTVVLFAYE